MYFTRTMPISLFPLVPLFPGSLDHLTLALLSTGTLVPLLTGLLAPWLPLPTGTLAHLTPCSLVPLLSGSLAHWSPCPLVPLPPGSLVPSDHCSPRITGPLDPLLTGSLVPSDHLLSGPLGSMLLLSCPFDSLLTPLTSSRCLFSLLMLIVVVLQLGIRVRIRVIRVRVIRVRVRVIRVRVIRLGLLGFGLGFCLPPIGGF